jgi:hypothetical protein
MRPVPSSRLVDVSFVRCDACQAVNVLTESERLSLVQSGRQARTQKSLAKSA